ncbi:ANTAR domain-containing response regulator [Halalkalibacter alkaliphilus]|uniref:ANTAR domain-containing protein n=1 Tax=Halalkalibacter alkaliphilus TaxID=2917993 RepID=A0A9X2I997_9BACI|nr:ANTAR domain-containing protein [Halalkalibacter alkaliphilus]MCL7749319.1 ANTAR domain-containing protein [Halalkalibacter alkaliphilus]
MIDRFLLFIDPEVKDYYKPTDSTNLGSRLQDLGYRVIKTTDVSAVSTYIHQVDALIICSSIANIKTFATQSLNHRSLPLIWWFHEGSSLKDEICELEIDIDALLCSNMSNKEIHWSLHLCSNRFLQRIQWQKERELLLSKLEERKHLEKAKAILCELKKISEQEAYDFIRKQAMDERKRMVDVAISIITAYQILVANK